MKSNDCARYGWAWDSVSQAASGSKIALATVSPAVLHRELVGFQPSLSALTP